MEFENLTRVVVYDKDGDVMMAKGSSDLKLGMKVEGTNVMIASEMNNAFIRGWIIPMSEIGNIEFDAKAES